MKNFYALLATLLCLSASGQILTIPDANFKAKLLEANEENGIARDIDQNYIKIDTNNNSEIELSEALNVYHLFVGASEISNLSGISNFTNLLSLECSMNQLTSLDVSSLSNLYDLSCGQNFFTLLDLTGLSQLQYLTSNDGNLTDVILPQPSQLTHLELSYNNISSINTGALDNLTEFIMAENQLTSLDFSGMQVLDYVDVEGNMLTSLDLSGATALFYLQADGNQLTSLDISDSNPEIISVNDNQLSVLIIKNGFDNSDSYYNFANNPLQYICIDEQELESYIEIADFYGYSNISINGYCTFEPGGVTYGIDGINRFDTGNDGCSVVDPVYPNLRLSISGSSNGIYIADDTGSYATALPEGSYTVTPVLENPDYFTVTPPSVQLDFPAMEGDVTQDFCIAPNGTHPDLEVTLVPLTPSIPGFDTEFLLVYKNKGNQLQSGTITLTFDDQRMDFLESDPASVEAGGTLNWGFLNLYPSETQEIYLAFNINTPSDEVPVEIDDVLPFTATISSSLTDEMPEDNTMTLNEVVVGSFDPNDKTCLEGTTVAPSTAGDYVHYLIRFENTGTFPAQNIVVRDNIDTSKFNINSLIPLGGSHAYSTRITGNRVEFIFEAINLAFDDANNDGYVVFKIKTLPTLVAGNAFSNSAEIYFDYNLPVITEPAVTTFQALGRPDFAFNEHFTIYPNPVSTMLNVKSDTELRAISVYNALGQLVQTKIASGTDTTVDVSGIGSGIYFIRIDSDRGTSSTRFIKQ
ncbi:MAG TPA: T9SS type A sorting domain-containing protein [Flavobacterium sp.]|jgi:uncharacterized repeat protein (TIGR01451 family)